MQELSLKQTFLQRLTPQQIQLIKLLQVPAIDIKARIEQELADNPVLEEVNQDEAVLAPEDATGQEELFHDHDLDSLAPKQALVKYDREAQAGQSKIESASRSSSLYDQLLAQLNLLQLNKRQYQIGQHLIGSLENDGYIRRDLEAIVSDLSFVGYIETNVDEVAGILKLIQHFDPPGIGARNLQECLLIQLHRKKDFPAKKLAIQILTQAFEAFTKKHYEQLIKKLAIKDKALLKAALAAIAKLNPKPGERAVDMMEVQPLNPDFLVTKQGEYLQVSLTDYNTPALRIRTSYKHILATYQQPQNKDKKIQEAALFIKQKLQSAKWFIDAIKQRQQTLLKTMEAIVKLQYNFFLEQDKDKLMPMILKDIAIEIGMDVSTVSRIVNNKSVQTDFGIYPLKFFFTEGISTATGEEVSNNIVKKELLALIQQEDKQHPYADEKLTDLMQAAGYHLARRTVSKYREQLGIPVARLRKEI